MSITKQYLTSPFFTEERGKSHIPRFALYIRYWSVRPGPSLA